MTEWHTLAQSPSQPIIPRAASNISPSADNVTYGKGYGHITNDEHFAKKKMKKERNHSHLLKEEVEK